MIPQGTVLLNTQVFTNLTHAVNAAPDCASLQSLTTESFASIGAMKDAMNAEMVALEPILSLLGSPAANPTAIVTWINNFITVFLTPIAAPAVAYNGQLALLAVQIAALTSAITTAQGRFPSCSVTIPTI